MNEILYKKVGRKYVPVAREFTSFPAEGVFLVTNNGNNFQRIFQLKELSPVADLWTAIDFHKTLKEPLRKAMMKVCDKRRYSIAELIDAALVTLANEIGKLK